MYAIGQIALVVTLVSTVGLRESDFLCWAAALWRVCRNDDRTKHVIWWVRGFVSCNPEQLRNNRDECEGGVSPPLRYTILFIIYDEALMCIAGTTRTWPHFCRRHFKLKQFTEEHHNELIIHQKRRLTTFHLPSAKVKYSNILPASEMNLLLDWIS